MHSDYIRYKYQNHEDRYACRLVTHYLTHLSFDNEMADMKFLEKESFPGLGIGKPIYDFQIAGIRHDVAGVIEECCEIFNRPGSKVL